MVGRRYSDPLANIDIGTVSNALLLKRLTSIYFGVSTTSRENGGSRYFKRRQKLLSEDA